MRRPRSAAFGLVALTLLTAVLTGCGTGGGTTLRVIQSLTSPERTALLRDMITAFEAANPDVDVRLISPPLQSADQKIAQVLSAKNDVDLVEVRDYTVKQFVNNDSLLDLSPYVAGWPGWQELTPLARQKAASVGGKPYLVPYGFFQNTLFARTDRLAEKGIAPPTSWPELIDAAVKLTEPGKNRFGYSFRGGAGTFHYAVSIISAYVGPKVDPAQGFWRRDGGTIFAAPEAATAMEAFRTLFKTGSPPGSLGWSYPEMVQGFTSGVTSLLIQDPEVIKTTERATGLPKGSWTTLPIPKGPGGLALQPTGYAGWGVTSFSRNRDAAVKLLEFLSSAEQGLRWAKEHSLIPVHTAAASDPQFTTGAFKAYLDMAGDPAQVVVERPIQYPGWGRWQKQADIDVQSLLVGEKSVAEVLGSWDEFWAEQKKAGGA
ncbi:sugar ABC transporter substrate-binding protein [Crossiella sp. CA-258035]|uniref:ABC transporter substrate-binding protein n=1 Tax=Crossiella sp. CA-258035 TaxID=2981138 RepID=UPI0024BC9B19|nr:sugar ABC transporter substrate-binding protein [Crossiella sp. CA-258035]WHT18238.1 sugar ABC transporter substrate-binding protein [Crossiella sp. CA-258035]